MMWKYFILLATLIAVVASAKHHSDESDSSECSEEGPDLKTKYVCDEDVMHIKCRRGYLIHVLWANYGRTCDDRCVKHAVGDTTNTNCTNPNSTQVVQHKCNDKEKCEICATVGEFGDVCPATSKYLEVVFQCVRIQKCKNSKTEKFVVCRSKCPETCDSPGGDVAVCGTEPGCVCTEGNVYDRRSGVCLCKEMCPWRDEKYPKCKTREQFKNCATLCPRTCEDRFPQKPCPIGCKPGYECEPGYIRDTASGRCIFECDCPCCTQAPPTPKPDSASSSSEDTDETMSVSDSSSEECDETTTKTSTTATSPPPTSTVSSSTVETTSTIPDETTGTEDSTTPAITTTAFTTIPTEPVTEGLDPY